MALKYYEANSKIRQPNPKASYYADYDAIIQECLKDNMEKEKLIPDDFLSEIESI